MREAPLDRTHARLSRRGASPAARRECSAGHVASEPLPGPLHSPGRPAGGPAAGRPLEVCLRSGSGDQAVVGAARPPFCKDGGALCPSGPSQRGPSHPGLGSVRNPEPVSGLQRNRGLRLGGYGHVTHVPASEPPGPQERRGRKGGASSSSSLTCPHGAPQAVSLKTFFRTGGRTTMSWKRITPTSSGE